jgi:hypothetical protein
MSSIEEFKEEQKQKLSFSLHVNMVFHNLFQMDNSIQILASTPFSGQEEFISHFIKLLKCVGKQYILLNGVAAGRRPPLNKNTVVIYFDSPKKFTNKVLANLASSEGNGEAAERNTPVNGLNVLKEAKLLIVLHESEFDMPSLIKSNRIICDCLRYETVRLIGKNLGPRSLLMTLNFRKPEFIIPYLQTMGVIRWSKCILPNHDYINTTRKYISIPDFLTMGVDKAQRMVVISSSLVRCSSTKDILQKNLAVFKDRTPIYNTMLDGYTALVFDGDKDVDESLVAQFHNSNRRRAPLPVFIIESPFGITDREIYKICYDTPNIH